MRTHRTEKQIEASRRNGAKSRGPVTPQGLANCAGNRLRHGFYARAVVLPGESIKRFTSMVDRLYAQFSPQDYCDQILVEKMAIAQWRLMRLWSYERSAIIREAAKQREASGLQNPSEVDALAWESLSVTPLTAHEMQLDRQFNRALDRLLKLKRSLGPEQLTQTKGIIEP